MRVRLVTCREMPCPDEDEPLLTDALRRRGLDVGVEAWDDDAVSWRGTLAVIRSTWNYVRRYRRFLAWVDATAREGSLHNPADVVRWNSHKRYLVELAARGVPVVPTALLARREATTLAAVVRERGWRDVVVKPAVSAGSFRTLRVGVSDAEAGERHLASLLTTDDVLVQPYLDSVESYGERSLVFVDGDLTHAVRKAPRFSAEESAVTGPHAPARDEVELAREVLRSAGRTLLYARVDVARDGAGAPVLMELEAIEPSLYLRRFPPAAERLAVAIERRARDPSAAPGGSTPV